MVFHRTIKNINRVRQLIEILVKYGFEEIVETTRLKGFISTKQKAGLTANKKLLEKNRWERIRLMIEELGPTFIKFGQLLSNRPDILPDPLIAELEKLQDQVMPFSFEEVTRIIESETSKPLLDSFSYFDQKPIGSASIGQVHRARLITGEDVVVKIQRPEATRQVNIDLSLIREFVKLTENYFIKAGIINPLEILDTYSKSLLAELDYSTEARHLEQFKKLYSSIPKLLIPKVYRELTFKRMLTIEFISGCRITETEILKSWGLDPHKIAHTGLNIYLSMMFDYGIFHADPHPGNVLIKPNGTIALVDFGMIGKLAQNQKYAFAGVFIGLANQDAKSMATNLRRLAVDHEIEDMRAFEYDLNDLVQEYVVLDTGDMDFREFTARLQKISYKYKLQMPGAVFLIFRALAILEGVLTKLDPQFNTLEAVKPYGVKLLSEQFSVKHIVSELEHSIFQIYTLFSNFPIEIRDIIKQIRKGKIVINYQFQESDRVIRKFDNIIVSIVLAMIISALSVAAAITYFADRNSPQTFLGIPYVSLSIIVVTGFLSFLLFVNIIMNKRI